MNKMNAICHHIHHFCDKETGGVVVAAACRWCSAEPILADGFQQFIVV